MNRDDFTKLYHALEASAKRHPNCRVANCDCDSKRGQWRARCYCLCHTLVMDKLFGKNKWTFKDFMRQGRKGIQPED